MEETQMTMHHETRAAATEDRRPRSRAGRLGVVAVLVTAAMLLVADGAAASTVSGTLRNAAGGSVVLVQANGKAKTVTLKGSSGAFVIRGVKLGYATLHLVRADGSYFGPVVLKASRVRDYCTIAGTANLRLGTIDRRSGYAAVRRAPRNRYDTHAPYTVTAKSGKPVGAGRVGLVRTGTPAGLNGAGGDLDRDGVVNAFDIDDNGNLILDNVDRSRRGARRPAARAAALIAGSREALSGGDPAPSPQPEEFQMFSNFKLNGDQRINVDIPGITDTDGLIAEYLPETVILSTRVLGGQTAELDGLGNAYILEHTLGDVVYPLIETPAWVPATHTGTFLDLVAAPGRNGGVLFIPGALPSEIGSGDAFVERTHDGVGYPGVLNFVFNTAPALKSYQFDTDASPTEVLYGADGVLSDTAPIVVPHGATAVTLTWWRPQRKAADGEAGEWIDMGGLGWYADVFSPAKVSDWPDAADQPGTHDATGAYSNAVSNGQPVATDGAEEQVIDPAMDRPANGDNTMSFTLSFTKTYSAWADFGPGTLFEFSITGSTMYGDNAACLVRFTLDNTK